MSSQRGGVGPDRPPRRHTSHRLFWRVYLHGVVLLVGLGVAVWLTARATGAGSGWKAGAERLARYVAEQLEPTLDEPEALAHELQVAQETLGADLAIFSANGTALAVAGQAPPTAEPSPPTAFSIDHRGHHTRYVVPLRGAGAAYLVARAQTPHRPADLGLVLAVVLGVLALGSVPLARAIARPLERLTAVVRRFGEGDLEARSGIQRRDEVGALAAAFDEMAARIDRLHQRDRELLANVSHELKTPLARIRVALELLEEPGERSADEPLPSPRGGQSRSRDGVHRHLEGIAGDLSELEQLVEDVMVMARLDRGTFAPGQELPLRREEVAMGDIIEDSRSRFARRNPKHEVRVESGAAPLTVEADPSLLRRVIGNLLDNAANHAAPEGGDVEIGLLDLGKRVGVEVRDRGPGVESADLPRLFEPFFRTDRSRDRATGGTGIGLALCARVVRAHGGDIEARHRDGGGLIVAFHLPSLQSHGSQDA